MLWRFYSAHRGTLCLAGANEEAAAPRLLTGVENAAAQRLTVRCAWLAGGCCAAGTHGPVLRQGRAPLVGARRAWIVTIKFENLAFSSVVYPVCQCEGKPEGKAEGDLRPRAVVLAAPAHRQQIANPATATAACIPLHRHPPAYITALSPGPNQQLGAENGLAQLPRAACGPAQIEAQSHRTNGGSGGGLLWWLSGRCGAAAGGGGRQWQAEAAAADCSPSCLPFCPAGLRDFLVRGEWVLFSV